MLPSGRSSAIDAARSQSTRIQDADLRNQNQPNNNQKPNVNPTTPNSTNEIDEDNDNSILELFDEKPKPTTTPNNIMPTTPRDPTKRQLLDAPKSNPTNIVPRTGVVN
jgi:hypothetical protein